VEAPGVFGRGLRPALASAVEYFRPKGTGATVAVVFGVVATLVPVLLLAFLAVALVARLSPDKQAVVPQQQPQQAREDGQPQQAVKKDERPKPPATGERPADERQPEPIDLHKVPPIRGYLVTLSTEFQANPVAAEKKYVGKYWRFPSPLVYDHKVEKRDGGYWIVVPIGIKSLHQQDPVYGVECKLSKEGEDQYAAGDKLHDMEMIGRIDGTRPYPQNIFGRTMLTISDCRFVEKRR
jgi:hypothetical protein